VGNGDVDADKYLSKLISTKTGRGLFPATSELIGATEHLRELGRNCANLVARTGKHLKKALGFFLVGGLPTQFAAEILNTTGSEINHFQKTPTSNSTTTLKTDYAANTAKSAFTEQEESVMETFFFRTTSVMSGAHRETRNLEKPQHEWEEEMYAVWPQMLRNAVRSIPELAEAKQPMTKKEQEQGAPYGMAHLFTSPGLIMNKLHFSHFRSDKIPGLVQSSTYVSLPPRSLARCVSVLCELFLPVLLWNSLYGILSMLCRCISEHRSFRRDQYPSQLCKRSVRGQPGTQQHHTAFRTHFHRKTTPKPFTLERKEF
jgi:hypothetical protein